MKLSSAQRFVLTDMQDIASRAWSASHYAQTRCALNRKGLIALNVKRGVYEITESGRDALKAQRAAQEAAQGGE